MTNYVDGLAAVLPWAGGLVPATMTYNNLVISGVEPWQAFVVAGVVEGLGFVAVTTVIDIYEQGKVAAAMYQVSGWAPMPAKPVDGMFWVALGGATLYLGAVFVINTFLDPAASTAKMITGGILSTFGVLGGVMVALRNQLSKRRQAMELTESRARQAEADARGQAERERERIMALQAEKDRQELEFQRALQVDKLRMAHELEMAKHEAESLRKMEKTRAQLDGSLRIAVAPSGQAPDGKQVAEMAAGDAVLSIRRWADVSPDDYGWLAEAPVGQVVAKYGLSGKDPERQARTWKGYAREKLPKGGEA